MECKILNPITNKYIDNLTGQTFNKLTALELDTNKMQQLALNNKKVVPYWICKCKCGAHYHPSVAAHHLKAGNKKDCHCVKTKMFESIGLAPVDSLVGMKFNRWTVKERIDSERYLCECECGIAKKVKYIHLITGASKSCGCYQADSKRERMNDVWVKKIGEVFSDLKIIDIDYDRIDKEGALYVICECTCGNVKTINYLSLSKGTTTSCGCGVAEKLRKVNSVNIIGHRYGKLVVVSLNEEMSNQKNSQYYLCKCDCGNTKIANRRSLASGYTKSCGCMNSEGEYKISKYLQECNVVYKTQVKFDNLRGVNKGKLSYDFYIPSVNTLIEYQGKYHDGNAKIQSQYEYDKQQEHDKRKREYAKDNNINLLEIWYYDNVYEKLNQMILNEP